MMTAWCSVARRSSVCFRTERPEQLWPCRAEDRQKETEDAMPNKIHHQHGLFEIALMGGVVAIGTGYLVSESAYAMTILSVTVLAIVTLFRDSLR